jgi:osmoprotectant transport system ATP-binding protein
MAIMLSLQEVTKIYPGAEHVKAVDSLSFDLEEGEICTLVGPSGCGKTTAMKMINRLIPMTSGKILIDDQNISRMDTIELRRNIGYVIQNIGLFPNMTIAENIATIPKLKGWDHDRITEKVESLLEIVNLPVEEFIDRYPRELSGGQQQRIGVARGMAADPPIMLMDEPFGAIDPINRESLQNEFLKIQEKVRKTIVFVTHDIDEAIKMGDKICLLKDGSLIQFDSPEKMLTEPANDFVRDFLGGDRTLKRLNLLQLKSAMRPDPPVIMQNESLEKAKSMFRELKLDHLIVVDNEKRLIGYVNQDALTKTADTVGKVTLSTEAFLPATSSLKDGLSEIFTHDELGYLIVVEEDKKVVGILKEEDIKNILRK